MELLQQLLQQGCLGLGLCWAIGYELACSFWVGDCRYVVMETWPDSIDGGCQQVAHMLKPRIILFAGAVELLLATLGVSSFAAQGWVELGHSFVIGCAVLFI